MSKKIDSDLERIEELWSKLPWYIKQRMLFLARYYVICNQINRVWENVNLAWFRFMM